MNAADLLWAAAVAATLSGMVCYEVGRARGFRKGYEAGTALFDFKTDTEQGTWSDGGEK